MVCLGNICRSPTAEGVFRTQIQQQNLSDIISVDSAGTSDWHINEAPDSRSAKAAEKRGYDLSQLRGRQVNVQDFHEFDYVLAMDNENFRNLLAICPEEYNHKVKMFLSFGLSESTLNTEQVPDPYHSGLEGFEFVLDLIEDAGQGLLNEIINTHQLN